MNQSKLSHVRLDSKRIGVLVILVLVVGLFNLGQQLVRGQSYSRISFGEGSKIQFVDPDGINGLAYSYFASEADADITFVLYNVPQESVASLYDSLDPQTVPDVSSYTQAATWTETATSFDERKSYQLTTIPNVASGIYLVTAKDAANNREAATLVNVSRTALILKADSAGRMVVWASTLQNGAPVPSMAVTIYDLEGKPLGNSTTNSDGVAIIDTGTSFDLTYQNNDKLVVIGQSESEVAMTGADYNWRENRYSWYGATSSEYTAYLYTERPLYKPGDTIHFKMIVRQSEDGAYKVAANNDIKFTLTDSRGDKVDTVELTTDEFGTAHGEFSLSSGVPLGSYSLRAEMDDAASSTFYQALEVEEFQKPEYSVTVTGQNEDGDADYGIAGQPMKIAVAAEYFFGQPTANADVTVQVFKSSYRWYYGWWEWGYYDYYPQSANEFVTEFSGKTDANGLFVESFTPESDAERTTSYSFKATVTDAQGLPIDGSLNMPVHWNAAKMTVRTEKYGYTNNDPVIVNVALQNHDGSPLPNTEVTISAEAEWYGYETTSRPPVTQKVTTDANGKAQATFENLSQGWYRIKGSMTDSLGRDLEHYNYVSVYKRNGGPWYYFRSDDLMVTVDKDSYAVGDVAQLLIQSRLEPTMALVTLERESVLEEILVKLDEPVTTVQVPVTEKLGPNAIIKVHAFKLSDAASIQDYSYQAIGEAQLVMARTEMRVPVTNKRLKIDIEADADEYLPGSKSTLTLKVTDHEGNPVRAQVSLAMVDQALLALQPDLSADLFETFYRARGSNIATYQSITRPYFYQPFEEQFGPPTADTATPEPATPSEPTNDANDDAGREKSTADIALREEFLDTAIWRPALVTDDNGSIVLPVDLPDNLTTWEIFAKAVTVETQVGEANDELLVTQDVIARTSKPRFAVLGDRFQVGAVGQNYTGADHTGQIDMSCSNLILLDDGAQALDLPNGGTDVAHWTAVASQIGMGTVTTTLMVGDGGDRLALPMEVKPFAVPDRKSFVGNIQTPNQRYNYNFDVPSNAINEASLLRLNLSPSLALSLLDSLDTLINYPYGCVEQTMSRLMPAAAASKVYQQLGIPNPKEAELPAIMQKGVNRLTDLQYANGGWGWYGAGEINQHMTAYVLLGLTMVQEAGFPVPAEVLDKGFEYLDQELAGLEDYDVQAYILYVKSRAGRGDHVGEAKILASRVEQLDSYSVSILAEMLFKADEQDTADKILSELRSRIVETPTNAYLPTDSKNEWYHWRSMASDEKNTAAAISTLSKFSPSEPLLFKMVRWLLDQQKGGHYYSGAGWGDTQATAAAINGLLAYILASSELEGNFTYTVLLNGTEVAKGSVTPETFAKPIEPIIIDGELLRTGDNDLEVLRSNADGSSGKGTLYINGQVRLQVFYPEFEAVTESDQGIKVSRAYYRYDPTAKDGTREYLKGGEVEVGELIDAEVRVSTNTEMAYVLVSAPIPAGFEVVDDGVGTSPYCGFCGIGVGDDFWSGWGYSYKDIRTDKVEFFVPQLYKGDHVYRFRMRAVTPGVFSTMPAEAGPMYDGGKGESLWGRSGSAQFTIAPEELEVRPTLAGDYDNDCRVSDFDAKQVAAAWGTDAAGADIALNDGIVDLRDVVQIDGRVGSDCLVDLPAPDGNGGNVKVALQLPVAAATLAETFDVNVVLVDGRNLANYALTLNYDQSSVAVDKVTLAGPFANAEPLGPNVDSATGKVTFGVYGAEATVSPGATIATVTFRGISAGETSIELADVQAASLSSRMMTTEIVDSNQPIVLDGEVLYVPLIQ